MKLKQSLDFEELIDVPGCVTACNQSALLLKSQVYHFDGQQNNELL